MYHDELKKNQVITVILNTEFVSFQWAQHFRRLDVPGPEPIGVAGRPFDDARNQGVREMLANPLAQWLFFLDSDVCVPPGGVRRLMSWNLPLVSGMYCRRSPPHAVPVMMKGGQWVTELPSDPREPLAEVEVVGAGCLLVHRTVFEAMLRKPMRPGKTWFDWTSDARDAWPPQLPPGWYMSEDYTFCRRVREHLGIKVMVDTGVRCKHVGLAEADFGSFAPAGSTPFYQAPPPRRAA